MTTVSTPGAPGVSSYALYSEAPSQSDPEFIHLESIPARARLFDWNINIHIHLQMFQLVYVRSGEVLIHLDGTEIRRRAPCIITVPAGVVHGFEFQREATTGYVVTVSRALLTGDVFVQKFPLATRLLHQPQVIDLAATGEQVRLIDQLLEQLQAEYDGDQLGRGQMFEWLFMSLLLRAGRELEQPLEARGHSRYEARYRSLWQLVEKHYREHQPLSFYAQQLNTTVASINRTCNAMAGIPLGELLQDRLVLEAQRMLIYSSVPVTLIAYDLGFSDPAYFSRFFRRRVGASPIHFREAREAEGVVVS